MYINTKNQLENMDPKELVEIAREAKENAYEPYSEYSVGAAVLTTDGRVFKGVNIENITYDMCSHAERTAIKSAIANGERDFQCLAISTESEGGEPPCGTCRQFLAEFCGDEFVVYSDIGESDNYEEYRLGDIFPHAFRPKDVEEATE
jgi:cytidine deaminase